MLTFCKIIKLVIASSGNEGLRKPLNAITVVHRNRLIRLGYDTLRRSVLPGIVPQIRVLALRYKAKLIVCESHSGATLTIFKP